MSRSRLSLENKTIALVGLMGCGKSTIGKRLARTLELPFIDLDNYIEEVMDMPVSEIFEKHGEAYFRDLELKSIEKILDGRQVILATGGGAFINDSIRKIIKAKAFSVWINADLTTLLERVSRKNNRPLLENGDKEQILKDLMEKRYPIYEQADITVNTTCGTHEVVLQRIIEAINEQS